MSSQFACRRPAVLGCALLALSAVPSASSGAAASESAATKASLVVEVHGLRNEAGRVAVALFDEAEAFPDQERSLRGSLSPIRKGRATVVFEGLKPGVYAVAVLHDENKNDRMDFNFLGMPREGYGFSRDAPVLLGPPSFDSAAFRLRARRSIVRIEARYFSL